MPDLRGLLADPQFKALPIERQKAILARVNPQLAEEYASRQTAAAPAEPAAPADPWQERSVGGMLRNAGQSMLGAVKGAAETAYLSNPVTMGARVGQAIAQKAGLIPHDLTSLASGGPPQTPAMRLEAEMLAKLQPSNEAQAVGRGAERFAEFAAPVPGTPVKGLVGAGFQGLRGAGTTLLQGGTPKEALVSGAISAGGPLVASLGAKLGPALKEGAQRQMARVLGPTTKENKAITERVVPELLDRGFKGATRKSLHAQAAFNLAKTGKALETALDAVPKGTTVNTGPIVKHLDDAKQAFVVNGVEIDPTAVRRLDGLKETITQLGADVDYRSLRRVRQIYDQIVADARGFHGKTVAEGSTLDAQRELANAIRRELAKATPDVAKVNKEYSFWANVEKVLGDTLERTQSQSKPLGEQVIRAAATGGGVTGFAMGSPEATGLAVAIAGLNKVIRTPAWNTWSAGKKHQLATLMASGKFDEAVAMLSRGGAAATAQGPREQERTR